MTTNQVPIAPRKPTMPIDPSKPPDTPPPTPNGVSGTKPCNLLSPLSKLDRRRSTNPLQKTKPRHPTTFSFRRTDQPVLRFSLPAWLKLQLLCHAGDTEIGAFAITSPEDPLYVVDLVTIKQSCSCISVEFDDEAVADFFDEQVDAGRAPDQFFRIWAHTHPGDSPQPSGTDEETFQRVFGTCDWAVMFILAKGGATYCRLRVNSPPKQTIGNEETARRSMSLSTTIPCEVDYTSIARGDLALPLDKWMEEYARNVSKEVSWWEVQDTLEHHGLLFQDEQDEADLVDQLLELDDEALRSLMVSLEEQEAHRGVAEQEGEVADAQ